MMLFKSEAHVDAPRARVPVGASRTRRGRAALPRAAELDVLLLDGEHRQTLAALRAFARADMRVGAAVCESEAWWAPALRSRFCAMGATLPDLGDDLQGYADAIVRMLDDHPSHLVIPAYDGSIQAVRLKRSEIEAKTALPLATEAALDIAVSKTRTLAVADKLGIPVPRSIPVDDPRDLDEALREVGLPAVVKPYESWVERNGKGVRLSPNVVSSVDEARETFEHVLEEGGRALIQPWLPGRREAVTLFYANGRFWARMAQVSYREWPVLGGASVLCETIPLLPDITAASERLVQAIELEGCSMVEFRRDRHGTPFLMEINPRMGGSVALAINAGVNFPQMLYDWKVSEKLRPTLDYQIGKRLRWLAGDVWNLKCVFEMQGHPDIPSRTRALSTFLLDSIRPPSAIDGFEGGDLRPAFAEFQKMLLRHGVRRMRTLISKDSPA